MAPSATETKAQAWGTDMSGADWFSKPLPWETQAAYLVRTGQRVGTPALAIPPPFAPPPVDIYADPAVGLKAAPLGTGFSPKGLAVSQAAEARLGTAQSNMTAAANTADAQTAAQDAAAPGTNYAPYVAGGLAALGAGLGYLGARQAAGSAAKQRAQVASQAAAAKEAVTADVERFRENAASQAARGAASRGLLDSGLSDRTMAGVNARAEDVLGAKLKDIEIEKLRAIAEIPTDDEIWAGFTGQLAGTALGLAGATVGGIYGGPLGAGAGGALGQRAGSALGTAGYNAVT